MKTPKPKPTKTPRKEHYVGTRFEASTYFELARDAQATNDHNVSGVVRAIVRQYYQRRTRKGRYASPQARKRKPA